MAIFDEKNEIREWCKGVHCVDLGESFPTSILQNLASIQPSRRRRERALSSLPALRVQIPQVFKHYARAAGDESEGIVSAAAMDRRAIGAAISVATNTVCQQDDARVAQILARYANGSGTLLLDEFLEYWRSRLGGTQMCRSQLSSDAKLTLLAI